MSNLNHGILKQLRIPVPPFSEQKWIVNTIKNIKTETRHLESVYQRKIAALDELKKSLLHQAFSGEL